MKNAILAAAFATVFSLGLAGRAATLSYSDGRGNSSGGGTFSTDTNSADGNGSLKLQTPTTASKVSVVFEGAYGKALGTLGDLQSISLDYLKSSTPALNDNNTVASQFAYRVLTNAFGSQALIWENQYNGNSDVPTDTFQTISLAGGNFWQRANNVNLNGGSQAHPISYYTAGNYEPGGLQLSASTPVYGLEVAYGSGVGAFSGNVDNVVLTFGGASSATYIGAVQAPEPASIAMVGLGSIGLLARRRK